MTNRSSPKLFIAGMGMVTPVGSNVAMTAAAVNAGISAYRVSEHYYVQGLPLTLAIVPQSILSNLELSIDDGNRYDWRHDQITKMAIIAIREACAQKPIEHAIPIIAAMTDIQSDKNGFGSLIQNLVNNCQPWLSTQLSRSIHSGRAAGMEAIAFAFKYLLHSENNFLLVGGSDSYQDDELIASFGNQNRLMVSGSSDSFVPGEAASFLLLTPHPHLALIRNQQIIALSPPGIAEESGHLFSEQPYRGDGLDRAFKNALIHQREQSIHSIYSSMNGENHWAKEYGVAFLRNRKKFKDNVRVQHPSDCYGDLGSATATTLIALAAEHLFKNNNAHANLVYSSSDATKRGAIVVEKIAVHAATEIKRSANSYARNS